MDLNLLAVFTAFSLGLLGSLHCVSMCGGISCALAGTGSVKKSKPAQLAMLLTYNSGRIISYSLAGIILGSGSLALIDHWQQLSVVLRGIAGVLLIAMGLYVAGISRLLVHLESLAFRLWQRVQPMSAVKANSDSPLGLFILGMIWGWLPCGLVYSTLLWAGALGAGGVATASLMVVFGLGTLPAMLLTGLFADLLRNFVQAKSVRWVAGFCIIMYGVWTLVGGYGHGHAGHSAHASDHLSDSR